jgi:hypothetical protein
MEPVLDHTMLSEVGKPYVADDRIQEGAVTPPAR